jgi:hypothetical protein
MRKELDEALCKKYPEIFRDRHGDMRSTAMVWGFECGDGWYDIIDAACAQIENRAYNNRLNNVQCHPVVATQVKEKYGTLRFYYVGGDDYVDGVVGMAEAVSAVTCETCGAPGRLREGGWIRTLCDEHAQQQGYDISAVDNTD